ncbi:STAS domain-containing protein [Paracoccus sp. (in: a-proteobacteria)]|uniref:STAS domain-containing protein n=1 Tax=Paracoccus sp. TaxID=267 RepID=UPI00396C2DC9
MHALPLPETFDRKAAATFSRSLLDHRGTDAVLDASGVQRLGAIGVELLIAARKQWQVDGKALSIKDASQSFLDTLGDIGTSLDSLQTGVKE